MTRLHETTTFIRRHFLLELYQLIVSITDSSDWITYMLINNRIIFQYFIDDNTYNSYQFKRTPGTYALAFKYSVSATGP